MMSNMKIKWLIQTTGFKTNYLEITAETLKKLQFNFSDFGFFDNEDIIVNLENCLEKALSVNYIMRGGTKILRIIDNINNIDISNLSNYQKENFLTYKEKLKNAIDYDVKKFDQNHYSKFDLPLLNKDSICMDYEECKHMKLNNDMFIKPSRDLKAFNGGILHKDTSIEEFIYYTPKQSFYKEETIVIAELKNIFSEYRFFIIEDKIITGSLYMRNNKVICDNFIPEYILNVAKEYCKLYKPADIFVMDIAETDKGIFIVEYNCWNSSGLYLCDVQKLFFSVNEFKLRLN